MVLVAYCTVFITQPPIYRSAPTGEIITLGYFNLINFYNKSDYIHRQIQKFGRTILLSILLVFVQTFHQRRHQKQLIKIVLIIITVYHLPTKIISNNNNMKNILLKKLLNWKKKLEI